MLRIAVAGEMEGTALVFAPTSLTTGNGKAKPNGTRHPGRRRGQTASRAL